MSNRRQGNLGLGEPANVVYYLSLVSRPFCQLLQAHLSDLGSREYDTGDRSPPRLVQRDTLLIGGRTPDVRYLAPRATVPLIPFCRPYRGARIMLILPVAQGGISVLNSQDEPAKMPIIICKPRSDLVGSQHVRTQGGSNSKKLPLLFSRLS